MVGEFERKIISWCRLHPDDLECQHLLQGFAESSVKKKAESKRWKRIADELKHYEERKR